ncbi:NAD(P)H-dependent flavin oxidoreductase [[Acidovorax] ebreus]|uniref:NAD(P)H-dependent flavin oxidoreductase n=1 Tax=Diaphorobacter sp. LI3 TaxID=2952886 RepID=UPI00205D4F49|nr:nitronate monooxygenase [Diaphorobacter sp. LI3]
MNALLQRLQIDLPLFQGPMTGSDTPQLAAAVSQAGGLGFLGCGMRSPQAMREVAAAVRAATAKPFGMNLFVLEQPTPDAATVQAAIDRLAPLYADLGLPPPEAPARWCEDFHAQFEALLEARPAVASFTFGILTAAQVARLQAVGSTVIGTATTLAEAQAWAAVGADAVCASGMEAGGHRGTFLTPTQPGATGAAPSLADFAASMVGTLPLVAQCAQALSIPVIAAGGIMDGRGIAGALALGAQAVQMGTAFLNCSESAIGPAYREALAHAQATDTRTTRIFSGRPARGIVNRMMQALQADESTVPPYPVQNALTGALRRAAAQAGQADCLSLWAGQGVAQVRPMPAAQLVALLAQEWQQATAPRSTSTIGHQ